MSHRHISRPRGNTASSSSSSTSSSSDLDLDAITPCPPHSHPNALLDTETAETQTQPQQRPSNPHHHRKQRPTSWRSTVSLTPSSSSSSTTSDQDTAATSPSAGDPEATDPETLWRRMLTLQRTLGCYNSARMRAALEQENPEEGGGVRMFPMPFNLNCARMLTPHGTASRTCLDLLNDNIVALSDEERIQVDAFLHMETGTGTETGTKKGNGWRGRWLGGRSVR